MDSLEFEEMYNILLLIHNIIILATFIRSFFYELRGICYLQEFLYIKLKLNTVSI